MAATRRIRLGISTCLLGRPVRYDGRDKLDPFLAETWGRYVDYVPVCPEVECGFGVPRETTDLHGDPHSPRLIGNETGRDRTDEMLDWTRERLDGLAGEELDGYVFRCKSPACALRTAKIKTAGGRTRRGMGLFARGFVERFPLVAVEEDLALRAPGGREAFLERVFTLRRWRELLGRRKSARALAAFHAAHRLAVMSHGRRALRELDEVAAGGAGTTPSQLYAAYQAALLDALRRPATGHRPDLAGQSYLSPEALELLLRHPD